MSTLSSRERRSERRNKRLYMKSNIGEIEDIENENSDVQIYDFDIRANNSGLEIQAINPEYQFFKNSQTPS